MLQWVTTMWLLAASSATVLFSFQTLSVLLLSQFPPLQVSRTLQAVHCGSQEDNNAGWNQLGGHPALDSQLK